MTRRVQTLLEPAGIKSLAEASIYLPPELEDVLRSLFSFDVSGSFNLEGGNIYKSLLELKEYCKRGESCLLRFMGEDVPGGGVIYGLMPIDQAGNIIDFIEDQLSERPTRRGFDAYADMKGALRGNRPDIVGWFDLDYKAFLFKGSSFRIDLICQIMGTKKADLPRINRLLDLDPLLGDHLPDAAHKLGILARHLGYGCKMTWNTYRVTARSDGSTKIDPPFVPVPAPKFERMRPQ